MKAAALLLLAAHAAAFFGRSEPQALLWLPAEGFSSWEEAVARLERAGLRPTLAVTPAMIERADAAPLRSAAAAGKLELALRLEGDPILPLVANHPTAPRPQDPFRRMAEARERFRVAVGSAPAGFVPGGGALDPSVLPALAALGFAWAASGDYLAGMPQPSASPVAPEAAEARPWLGSSRGAATTVIIPFQAARGYGRDPQPEDLPPAPAPVVWDEAAGAVTPGALLREADRLGSRRRWRTAGEAAAGRRGATADAALSPAWPSWLGGLDAWSSHPASRRAWQLYGQTAAALAGYQNSGAADLKTLQEATEHLYRAQSERLYRSLGAPETESAHAADRELREHLRAVYRRVRQSPPPEMFRSLLEGGAGDEASGIVGASRGPNWVEFRNPEDSLALAAKGVRVEDGSPAAALWRIRSLRVEAAPAGTVFLFRMQRLSPAAGGRPFPEMGPLLLETYIDLNGVLNAGSSSPLHGRAAFIQARDAWEYALSVSARGAVLYRANPAGAPRVAARLAVAADSKTGEIRVTVPPPHLQGRPDRWGFVVTASALDPTAPADSPRALPADAGGGVLGVLAPLELQEALLKGKGRPRLAAVRASASSTSPAD